MMCQSDMYPKVLNRPLRTQNMNVFFHSHFVRDPELMKEYILAETLYILREHLAQKMEYLPHHAISLINYIPKHAENQIGDVVEEIS